MPRPSARRAVAGLSLTSTIRGRPPRLTCVRRRFSRRCVAFASDRPSSQPDHLHLRAGWQRIDLLGHDCQPVGRSERREHVRLLPAGQLGLPAVRPVSTSRTRRKARRPGRLARTAVPRRAWTVSRPITSAVAGKPPQHGPHEELEGDQAADRVAGQAEQEHLAAPSPRGARPNASGLPGWTATRHRSMLPDRREGVLDDVVSADRHTAAGDHHVRPLETLVEQRADGVELVAGDTQRARLGAGFTRGGEQARRVAVGDLRRPERRSRPARARRPWRAPRRAAGAWTREPRVTAGGGHGDLRRRQLACRGSSEQSPARRSLPARRMCAPAATGC